MSNRRLGVLAIATGGYSRYLPGLHQGLTSAAGTWRVSLVCFSDVHPRQVPGLDPAALTGSAPVPIRWVPWGAFDWPLPTLLRFEAFSRSREALADLDHLLYLDVDMAVNGPLGADLAHDLVAVTHPGYSATPERAPFTDDPQSGAYLPPQQRRVYVCGGVQGGTRESYLAACDALAARIRADLGRGHIPQWHDESYWNAWVAEHAGRPGTDVAILPPEYCWPEEWVTATQPGIIVALRKPLLTRRRQPALATARDLALRSAGTVRMRLRRPGRSAGSTGSAGSAGSTGTTGSAGTPE